MKQAAFFAAALYLLVGWLVLRPADAELAPPVPADPPGSASPNPSPELLAAAPLVRRPGAPEKSVEAPAAKALTPPAPSRGSLAGKLLRADGLPVPRGRILLERASGGPDGGQDNDSVSDQGQGSSGYLSVEAGADGDFLVSLETGHWHAYYAGDGAPGSPTFLWAGEALVEADRQALLDVVLGGERILAGGFFRPDRDSTVLDIEIFRSADPERVAAKGMCITSTKDYTEFLEQLNEPQDVAVPLPAHPPGMGYFELGGLAPDLYLVKVYMDCGHNYAASFQVDLRGSDKSFEPVAIAQADFLAGRDYGQL